MTAFERAVANISDTPRGGAAMGVLGHQVGVAPGSDRTGPEPTVTPTEDGGYLAFNDDLHVVAFGRSFSESVASFNESVRMLSDTPLSPDETADLEREEEPTEPLEGPGRVRPVYEDDAELGGEG